MFRVVEAVPSLAWLGAALDPPICKQAVSRWDRVPLERVREVSLLTNIPAHEIRPDVFDPPAESVLLNGTPTRHKRRG